jgi:hypothetical protein
VHLPLEIPATKTQADWMFNYCKQDIKSGGEGLTFSDFVQDIRTVFVVQSALENGESVHVLHRISKCEAFSAGGDAFVAVVERHLFFVFTDIVYYVSTLEGKCIKITTQTSMRVANDELH